MKQNLLNKFWLRVCMIVAIMTTALAGSVRAEEVVYYSLDGNVSGGSNGYATVSEIIQTYEGHAYTWNVLGNTQMTPWRLGGKELNGTDRYVVSYSSLTPNITKVVVTNGTATATVNSMTLLVSDEGNYDDPVSAVSGEWKASGTTTFERPAGADWTDKCFKLVYNITTSGTSNQYAQLVKIDFYCNTDASAPSVSAANLSIAYDATEGEIEYTVNNPVTGGSLSASTTSDWLTLGDVDDTIPFECEANTGVERTATVTLTYAYGTESVTKNVTVTQAANPNIGNEATPYTVAQARAAIDAGSGTQGVYATGIVTAIPTAWSTQYNNITFNFVDAEGDTDFLQAYRCVSTDAADASKVAVGDIVVVKGNLTKYNATYEFGQGCELVSLTHPAVAVEEPVIDVPNTFMGSTTATITCATTGATIYYSFDGTTWTEYTAALNITETTTIYAKAAVGEEESTVVSATTTKLVSMTISEVREQGTGSVWTEGIVTSVSGKTAYIQDEGAAIVVYGDQNLECSVGDEIDVEGTLSEFNGLLEIVSPVIEILSTGNTVEPEVMTIAEVNASTKQGWLVKIEGATVTAIDSRNVTIAQGENTVVVRFNATSDVTFAVNDVITLVGNIGCHNGVQIANPTDITTGTSAEPVIVAEDATIAYDVTYYELMYSIENPVEGTQLTASTTASWITSLTPSQKSFDRVMIECEANEGEERSATIVLTYGSVTKEVTFTQEAYAAPVEDYATLPFNFAGGTKDELLALAGVTANGLGSDYAASNAPYRVKFDTTGDYIQVKTNERPGIVTIDVKMLGGANASTITVQESADGETFTDLQELAISGAQNTVLTLKTNEAFDEASRYVRLFFTKGSNVGVGPISIAQYADIVIDEYTLAIANPDNVTITASYGEEVLQNGENASVAEGTEVTLALSIAEGYDFESITITGAEEGQTVTPAVGTTEGVYTFIMPAYDVTVNATVVEHIEPVMATYVLATSITSGKTYVIANADGTKVMAEQRNNNRGTVDATLNGRTLTAAGASEFTVVIEEEGDDAYEYFVSIYDPQEKGYLSAASSGSNYLRTPETFSDNGKWGIVFDRETNEVKAIAQGTFSRNVIRYNATSDIFACYASAASQGAIKFYEKVEEVPTSQTVAVTEAGYATFVAEANLTVPADVEGTYSVKVNGSYAVLTAVNAIPAGAAVIVKASAGTYDFAYTTDEVAPLEGNELVAATAPVTADGTQYILANGANGIGFYKAETGTTIPAGKAYLVVTSGVKGFYGFEDEDATAIEMVGGQSSTDNGSIYNLAGQRMGKMQKGINIVSGKKIAVK